jgi:DNA primase
MAGHIPREFIDHLLSRVDIVDVINARVPLKKAGREYTACCPFHNEKTPSFTVSPNKQFYHCFGCGVHGSAVNFLMEYEHLDFVEAIESLATTLGIEVPYEKTNTRQNSEKQRLSKDLFSLLEAASEYFQLQLKTTPVAKTYLTQRGLSEEIIKQFKLGYSPEAWNELENHLSPNYSTAQLLESGLSIKNENNNVYDRFRGRIMFPIRNRKGLIIGYGGRIIGDGNPKYLNSPETPLFNKGTELYGFYEARQHTRKLEKLLVVEGYMDVIALAQYGISYAVATLGTATTSEHIQLIFRNVPEVIFCFDGDRAGRDAAWRALENALPQLNDGKEIRFLFLPEGEDPDSLIRQQGKEGFEKQLEQAIPLSNYLLDALQKQFNLSSLEGKARFLEAASQLLKKIPENLIKSQLVTNLEKMTSVDGALIRNYKLKQEHTTPKNTINTNTNSREIQLTPIRYALALLLTEPSLVELAGNPEKIAQYHIPGADFFANILEIFEESPNLTAAGLIEKFRDTKYEALLIHLTKWQASTTDIKVLQNEFQDCLRQIRKKAHETQLEALLHKERVEGLSSQEKHDLLMLLADKKQ